MKRVAFDLDETLGVPLIERRYDRRLCCAPRCAELLTRLSSRLELVIWTVSSRRYIDKVLAFGLGEWFVRTYSWDEQPAAWKDVRRIGADWLIADNPHHREAAARHGLADRYVVVPAYGSPEDDADPLGWAALVEDAVLG